MLQLPQQVERWSGRPCKRAIDISPIVRKLATIPTETAPATALRTKVTELLLISLCARASDLTRLRRGGIEFDEDGMIVWLDWTKEARLVGKLPPPLRISKGEGELDTVAAVKRYMELTPDATPDTPIITRIGKCVGLSAGYIGKIAKQLILSAGITGVGGGILRGAAASAAVRAGVSIATVKRHGRWSATSTVFEDRYMRTELPVDDGDVAKAVLSLQSIARPDLDTPLAEVPARGALNPSQRQKLWQTRH
jgi:hypothetical protein